MAGRIVTGAQTCIRQVEVAKGACGSQVGKGGLAMQSIGKAAIHHQAELPSLRLRHHEDAHFGPGLPPITKKPSTMELQHKLTHLLGILEKGVSVGTRQIVFAKI